MIVKILSSASSFAGINYSEQKNDQGKSQLLAAANFDPLNLFDTPVKSDYINYMKAVSALNPKVSNKQFHAVLSVKGKSTDVNWLKSIAEQFLEKMGYGRNPYLIYLHRDTDNLHVHLVSTRVDKQGQKINDSFERVRSQEVLQSILGNDVSYQASEDASRFLAYQFTTQAQIQLLAEQNGYRTSIEKQGMSLIRHGKVRHVIPLHDIDDRITQFKSDRTRERQLRALLSKYKNHEYLHAKLGIQLIFHRGKNASRPYGYTVIDHARKTVYKGSQLLKLNELITTSSPKEQQREVEGFLQKTTKKNRELFNELAARGYEVLSSGQVVLKGSKNYVGIGDVYQEKLRYAYRVVEASKVMTAGVEERKVLASLFKIDPEDVKPRPLGHSRLTTYQVLIREGLQTQDLDSLLSQHQLQVLQRDGKSFLFDPNEKALIRFDLLSESSRHLKKESSTLVNLLEGIQESQYGYNTKKSPNKKRKR